MLATTDPQKLLPTIISRCQRFDFTKLRKDQIKDHLLDIAKKENIYLDEEAAENIEDGSIRRDEDLQIVEQLQFGPKEVSKSDNELKEFEPNSNSRLR